MLDISGKDITEYFLRGAEKVLKIARAQKIEIAILKGNSPSCGCDLIHDGTFSGCLVPGYGITAALLMQNGIGVVSGDAYLPGMSL